MSKSKYEPITKYLKGFTRTEFGKWNEQTGDGTRENPYSMPYFIYDEDVNQFVQDFYELGVADYEYVEHMQTITEKTIDDLTENELITKLTAIIRGDRFCEGLLNSALVDGTILKILERLKTL